MHICQLFVVCTLIVSSAGLVGAQEKPTYLLKRKQTVEKKAKKAECDCADKSGDEQGPEKPPPEWKFKLRIGSVFQLSSNRAVVGRLDGTSRSFSVRIHAEANWKRRAHEVRNRFDLDVVFIKTPNTGRWVSSVDVLDVESIYQYRALPWFGPFARAGLSTSIFVGRDLRTNSVQYRFPDGRLTEEVTELRLTDPFAPVTLLQSAGAFVNPVREEELDLDIRGGLGARQVFASGQLGIQDDKDTTGIVEVVELRDYTQAGVELIGYVRGEMFDKDLAYYLGGEFLLPLVRSKEAGDDRGAVELIDKKVRFGVAYRLAKWATLVYEVRLVHQPQLIDQYQLQNNVGLKASYQLL